MHLIFKDFSSLRFRNEYFWEFLKSEKLYFLTDFDLKNLQLYPFHSNSTLFQFDMIFMKNYSSKLQSVKLSRFENLRKSKTFCSKFCVSIPITGSFGNNQMVAKSWLRIGLPLFWHGNCGNLKSISWGQSVYNYYHHSISFGKW